MTEKGSKKTHLFPILTTKFGFSIIAGFSANSLKEMMCFMNLSGINQQNKSFSSIVCMQESRTVNPYNESFKQKSLKQTFYKFILNEQK